MARVFLSYARDDFAAAEELAKAIARAGHKVWWDREIRGGARFASEIDRKLKEADRVVVLWSEAANRSVWVQDEAAEGRDTGRLVPVTMEGVKPPLGFRQFQSIDLSNWREPGLKSILNELLRALGTGAESPSRSTAGAHPIKPLASAKHSVCVLPFRNGSDDPEQEYFSDGISEDIITDLSKVSGLSVISRHTAFTFKGCSLDLRDLARRVGASHVVEGSIRKAGRRIRITAQLTDGASGNSLWADRFDRELTDIFEIQEEIARSIVSSLKVTLLPEERSAIEDRGTTSAEAYDLYLMARQCWVTGNDGDPRRDEIILRLCRSALDLDPAYARAWSLIALTQSMMRYRDEDLPEDGSSAAKEALRLDPALAEPHCVKAAALTRQGLYEDATRELMLALRLAPDSWEVNKEIGYTFYSQGRIEDAARYFERAAALMDTDYRSSGFLMTCRNTLGDRDGACTAAAATVARAEQAYAADGSNAAALAYGASALAYLGVEDRAREWIRRALLVDPTNLIVRYNLACVMSAHLSDARGALELLEQWFRTATASELRHIESDPEIEPLRQTEEYKAMLAAAQARVAARLSGELG